HRSGLLPRAAKYGQQQADQQRDQGDHDQQFNERKCRATFHRRLSNKTDPAKTRRLAGSGTGTSGAVVCPATQVQPSQAPSVSVRVPAPLPETVQAVPSTLRQYFHQSLPLLPTPESYQPSYSMPDTRSPKEK